MCVLFYPSVKLHARRTKTAYCLCVDFWLFFGINSTLTWTTIMICSFSISKLKKIGKKARSNKVWLTDADLEILSEYRESHNKILGNFRSRFSEYTKKNTSVLFGQRLKRLESIMEKIAKEKGTCIENMHDIAGARLIFKNVAKLNSFRQQFLNTKEKKYHRINQIDKYNYIKKPNPKTGYRGIHDVYEEITDDKIKLRIEIQYRTRIQHSWATAVEIWDSLHKTQLKSGFGDADLLKLFKLFADLFDFVLETDGTNKSYELGLLKHICVLEKKLNVLQLLCQVKPIETNVPEQLTSPLMLISKNNQNEFASVAAVNKSDIKKIFMLEQNNSSDDRVLVYTDPKILKEMYNNYFNDLSFFFNNMQKAVEIITKRYPFESKYIIFVSHRNFLKYTHKQP